MYRFFRYGFYIFLSFVNQIIIKKKNRIFFEDSNCIKDNQYYLCRYIENNLSQKYQVIYFTKKRSNFYHSIQSKVVYSTIKAFYYALTAKVLVFCYGTSKFQCIPQKGQIVLDLTHGMPIKKAGYQFYNYPYPYERCFTNFVVTSAFFSKVMCDAFHFKPSQALITGLPRNDLLFDASKIDTVKTFLNVDKKKIILYMPTFRNSSSLGLSGMGKDFSLLSEANVNDINCALKSNNSLLVVKLHHAQDDMAFMKEKYTNIIFLKNKELYDRNIDLYNLIGASDALITDYSSVYVDYMNLKRPIGFVFDDYLEYKEKRGFAFDNVERYMPGAKIYNEKDFIDFIENVFHKDTEMLSQYRSVNDELNVYKDENNCLRLVQWLEKKMGSIK